LEVKSTFNAIYSPEYFHFLNEDELKRQFLQTNTINNLYLISESKITAEVKLEIEFTDNGVIVKYEITFEKFYEELDFSITGEILFKLEAHANIQMFTGVFDIGGSINFTNEYSFSLGIGNKMPDDETLAKFKELANGKSAKDKNNVKLFETYIPTVIPVIGLSFEVKIVFELELKIELTILRVDEFKVEVGVKRVFFDLKPYFNKELKSETKDIELLGTIEAKIGIRVKLSGSVVSVLKLGISFEVGAYAKLAGIARGYTLDSFIDPPN
jgi:hypothetical protein